MIAITEIAPAMEDLEVLEMTVREGRVLLTEDKDFGQLVYAGGATSTGVILIRYPGPGRAALPGVVIETLERLGERLIGSFVVLKPGQIRIDPGTQQESVDAD